MFERARGYLQSMNQTEYYDKFTDDVFVKYFSIYNRRLAVAQKFCNRFVRTGDRVLEIGCGAGIIAKCLQNKVKYYFGSDLSSRALEIAKTVCAAKVQMKFVNKKVSELNFLESKFDAIVLIDVIEHLKNFHTDLQKLSEMLSDSGRFIIQCPTPEATAKNATPQIIEKPVGIENIILATRLRLVYLNYFGVEHENQYVQLVLAKRLSADLIEPNRLLSGLKSRLLEFKNRRILESLRNLPG